MRNVLAFGMAAAVALGASAGCATKGFVRKGVGATNEKVNAMIESLEETQSRTARTEQRIGEVDAKTERASRSAREAREEAARAANAARAAGSRVEALDRASRRLVYDVALTSDEAEFGFGDDELPHAAKVRIDGLIHDLTDDPQHCFIEIEGHTDNVGSPESNRRLGLARAEAVRRYLHETHDIPLHKINVISFGEERPAASNTTEAGRAQNRRVVIRVRT
jgi:outer membrane protein OmpA-like peptidoglycan-associated protein